MARDQHGFAVQTCNSRAIHMEQMNRPPGSGGFARRLPGLCARQDSASHNQCKDRRNRKSAHPRVRRLSHRGSSNATGPEPTGLAQCGRSLACFCGAGNPARSRLLKRLFRIVLKSSWPDRRLKAGGSHDWLPHSQVHTRYSACRRPLAADTCHNGQALTGDPAASRRALPSSGELARC